MATIKIVPKEDWEIIKEYLYADNGGAVVLIPEENWKTFPTSRPKRCVPMTVTTPNMDLVANRTSMLMSWRAPGHSVPMKSFLKSWRINKGEKHGTSYFQISTEQHSDCGRTGRC